MTLIPGPGGQRVVHVKGLTCFVAHLGGRPSPAVSARSAERPRARDAARAGDRAPPRRARCARGEPRRVSASAPSGSPSRPTTARTRSCSTLAPDPTPTSCTLGDVRCPSPGDAGSSASWLRHRRQQPTGWAQARHRQGLRSSDEDYGDFEGDPTNINQIPQPPQPHSRGHRRRRRSAPQPPQMFAQARRSSRTSRPPQPPHACRSGR